MSVSTEVAPKGPVEVRLYAFHHAGGSQALFQDWRGLLPESWDVRLLDAPGHGRLFGKPLIDDMDRLVEHFVERLGPELDGPYALFGHSMGGLVACALAHRLVADGLPHPVWLGVSAARVPGTPPTAPPRYALGEAQLRDYIGEMGGTPAQVLEDASMWEVFGPIIRADLRLVDSSRKPYDRPLPVPLSAFGGRADTVTPPERLAQWATASEQFLGVRLFDGGHFYLSDDPGSLLEHVVADVRTALALRDATPSSP